MPCARGVGGEKDRREECSLRSEEARDNPAERPVVRAGRAVRDLVLRERPQSEGRWRRDTGALRAKVGGAGAELVMGNEEGEAKAVLFVLAPGVRAVEVRVGQAEARPGKRLDRFGDRHRRSGTTTPYRYRRTGVIRLRARSPR